MVERFLSLFGDKARYFNNGEFANNSSDGFPLVPPGHDTRAHTHTAAGAKENGER